MADVQRQQQQNAAPSARAKHTKLALSKALNVTINRAPMQASLRKMLARSKVAKRRKSSAGGGGAGDTDELLQGFLGHDDEGDDNSKADEALAQVILGVCEDAENHFETLAEEKYVNAEFANLDAWIQEAQENLLRKRARSDSEHKDEDEEDALPDPDALSPEMLVLAERQRVVNDELKELQKLREQKAAQLAQMEKSVEIARRAAMTDIEKAQNAVAQVDDARHLVKDYAANSA